MFLFLVISVFLSPFVAAHAVASIKYMYNMYNLAGCSWQWRRFDSNSAPEHANNAIMHENHTIIISL